jgi:hypothetical protein
MSRLYFHLHDGVSLLLDGEGSELTLAEAIGRAVNEVRSLIAHEALEGRINLDQHLDLEDFKGTVLHTVWFSHAVEIIRRA